MVSPVCKAKDPRTCPYHGVVIRMNEAQTAGDFDQYFKERTRLEELKAVQWEDLDLDGTLNNNFSPKQAYKTNADKNRDDDAAYAARPDLYPPLSHPDYVSKDGTLNSNHPRIQAGEVLDVIDVVEEGYPATRFYRSSPELNNNRTIGGDFYAMRLQANRKLTQEEAQKLAGLTGYLYRSTVAGESIGAPHQDTPYSIVVEADSTKSRRDDLGDGINEFEKDINTTVQYGSPLRKTDRAGAGTKGTRLIDGFGEDLKIEIYYDA